MDQQAYLGEHTNVSIIKFYSKGIVAANKDTGESILSKVIEVTPIEVTKFVSGQLTDNMQRQEAKGMTGVGQAYDAAAITTASIQATWMSIGHSNRITAPNVRRGEEVIIYRVGDSNQFFWDTLANSIALRRLETVILAISGEPKLDVSAAIETNNCYYLQVSSHMGNILMQTSQANGEAVAWTWQFDCRNGSFLVRDTMDNQIAIQSQLHRVELLTGRQCQLLLDGEDMHMNVPGNLYRNVQGNIVDTVDGNVTRTVEGSSNTHVAGPIEQRSDSGVSVVGAEGVSLTGPGIDLNGMISSQGGEFGGDGSMTMKGNFNLEGQAYIKGSLKVDGSVDVQGDVTAYTYHATVTPW